MQLRNATLRPDVVLSASSWSDDEDALGSRCRCSEHRWRRARQVKGLPESFGRRRRVLAIEAHHEVRRSHIREVLAQAENDVALAHAGVALDEHRPPFGERGDDHLCLRALDELAADQRVTARVAKALVGLVDPRQEVVP